MKFNWLHLYPQTSRVREINFVKMWNSVHYTQKKLVLTNINRFL